MKNIQKNVQKIRINNQIRKINDLLLREIYNSTSTPQNPVGHHPQVKSGRDTEYATILRTRLESLQKEKSLL